MHDLAIAGLCLLGVAVVIAVACVVVSRVRARILRNEDAKAVENAVATGAEARRSAEVELREAMRRARLAYVDEPTEPASVDETYLGLGDTQPFSDPTETFNAEARTVLASVASNLRFVDVEPESGRSWSETEFPAEATDPWLNDAEIRESGEIAKATIAAIYNAEVEIPERTTPWTNQSFNGFDARREWQHINAAIKDPVMADVLKKRDPMMAFLLPVDESEPLPEFGDAVAAWAPQHRLDPGHDIDGVSISWHTGLTQAMRIVNVPAIESGTRAR